MAALDLYKFLQRLTRFHIRLLPRHCMDGRHGFYIGWSDPIVSEQQG